MYRRPMPKKGPYFSISLLENWNRYPKVSWFVRYPADRVSGLSSELKLVASPVLHRPVAAGPYGKVYPWTL
jgi:hypothetical protein